MELLRYVLLTNALLAVVSVGYYLLLRRQTFFTANRLALWIGLAGALILPLLKLPDWRPPSVRAAMERTAQIIVPTVLPPTSPPAIPITITFSNQKTYKAFQTAIPAPGWSWPQWLLISYLLGVVLLLMRLGIQLLSLHKLIYRSAHEVYDDFILVHNASVSSPFSFFGWAVLNVNQHTPDELEQILRHERVHIRERHSLDMLGAELVCILFWFNPAAYLFRYLLQQTLEFSADRAVLAEGIDAKSYQYNLVKVSLLSSQLGVTNHFSRSQLKSRIRMLNHNESTKITWSKYPLFMVVMLTVASAFTTRPLQALRPYIPTLPSREVTVNRQRQTASKQALIPPNVVFLDRPSPHKSPSKYLCYQGDRLYWIVTPKTTLDDFTTIKQELARYGEALQVNELKYDPLYAYISQVVVTVKQIDGGSTSCGSRNDNAQPISSIYGYVGTKAKSGDRGTGAVRVAKTEFPITLRQTAMSDEAAIATFVKAHRIDYLVQEGALAFQDLGDGTSTYPTSFFKNQSIQASGLIADPNRFLSVDEALGTVSIFINNKLSTPADLHQWKASQLHSVIKKSRFDPTTKQSYVTALLIYTTED